MLMLMNTKGFTFFSPQKIPNERGKSFSPMNLPIQQWPKSFVSHSQSPKTPLCLCVSGLFATISSGELCVFQIGTKSPFATSGFQSLDFLKLIIIFLATPLSVQFSYTD